MNMSAKKSKTEEVSGWWCTASFYWLQHNQCLRTKSQLHSKSSFSIISIMRLSRSFLFFGFFASLALIAFTSPVSVCTPVLYFMLIIRRTPVDFNDEMEIQDGYSHVKVRFVSFRKITNSRRRRRSERWREHRRRDNRCKTRVLNRQLRRSNKYRLRHSTRIERTLRRRSSCPLPIRVSFSSWFITIFHCTIHTLDAILLGSIWSLLLSC